MLGPVVRTNKAQIPVDQWEGKLKPRITSVTIHFQYHASRKFQRGRHYTFNPRVSSHVLLHFVLVPSRFLFRNDAADNRNASFFTWLMMSAESLLRSLKSICGTMAGPFSATSSFSIDDCFSNLFQLAEICDSVPCTNCLFMSAKRSSNAVGDAPEGETKTEDMSPSSLTLV